jgi:hypothetical protein
MKPSAYFENYYYHKVGEYNVVVQVVVDFRKMFTNMFMGLLGIVNDARVLCRSALYINAQYHGLFESHTSSQQFPPYLLGDKGYF